MKKDLKNYNKPTRWLVVVAVFACICSLLSFLVSGDNAIISASTHECYLFGDCYGIGQSDVDNLIKYIDTPEAIGLTPNEEPYCYYLKEDVSWDGAFVAPDGVMLAICLNGHTVDGEIDNSSTTGGIYLFQCGIHYCLEDEEYYTVVDQTFFDVIEKLNEGLDYIDIYLEVALSEDVTLSEDWVLSSDAYLQVCTNGYEFTVSENITANGGRLVLNDCSKLHDCIYFGNSAMRVTQEMIDAILAVERTPEAWGMEASDEIYCAYISEDLYWDGVLSAPDGVYIAICVNGNQLHGEIDNSKTKHGGIFPMQCGMHTCPVTGETTLEISNGYLQLLEAMMVASGEVVDFGTGAYIALNTDVTFTNPDVWAMPNTSSIMICTNGHTITNLDYLTVNGGTVNLLDCSHIGKHSCEYLQGETAEYLTQSTLSEFTTYDGVLKGENEQVWCLLGNVTLSKTLVIPSGMDLTICLNGYTLTSPPIIWGQQGFGGVENNICCTAIQVMPGASLTICDCSEKQTGKIVVDFNNMQGWGALASSAIINCGELNILSGKLIGVMAVLNAGDIIMDDGEIVGLLAGVAQALEIIEDVTSTADTTFVINGGEIHSAAAGIIAQNGDVVVNGGQIVSQVVGIGSSFELDRPSGEAIIYLNGGEITTGRIELSAYLEAGLPVEEDNGVDIDADLCVGVMSNTTIVFGGDVIINMEGPLVEGADYTASILMSGEASVKLAEGADVESVYEVSVKNPTDVVHVDPELEANVVPAKGVLIKTDEEGNDKIVLNDGSVVCNAEVVSASISLKGSLVFNIYVAAAEEFVNNPNAKVILLYKGVAYEYPIKDAKPNSYGYYVFTIEVSAKDYQKNIICNFTDGVNSWYGDSFTINKYLLKIINYNTMTRAAVAVTEEDKELAKRVQNYCMAASYHFGMSTDYTPDAVIVSEMAEVTKETLEPYGAIVTGSSDKIRFTGASLLLQSSNTIRFYFYMRSGYTIDDIAITVDGKTVAAKKEDSSELYYVEIANVRARDLGKRFLVNVDGYQVSYCALSYAYSVLKTPGMAQDVVNVAKSLYIYYKYAYEYFS